MAFVLVKDLKQYDRMIKYSDSVQRANISFLEV